MDPEMKGEGRSEHLFMPKLMWVGGASMDFLCMGGGGGGVMVTVGIIIMVEEARAK